MTAWFGTEGSEVQILSPRPITFKENADNGPGNRAIVAYGRFFTRRYERELVLKILSGIIRAGERYGAIASFAMLRGETN
jgi:hypothetical protein